MDKPQADESRSIPCPVCKSAVTLAEHRESFPFCTQRCKAVDLYRWMSGRYGLDPATGTLDMVDPDEAEDVSDEFNEH